jgi:hypothetical protein
MERTPAVVSEIDSTQSQVREADVSTILVAALENISTDVMGVEDTAIVGTKTEDIEDTDSVALVDPVEVDSRRDKFRMLVYRESR